MNNKYDDTKNSKIYKDRDIFKRLFAYMKPVKTKFIIALFLTLIVVLVDLIPSYAIGLVIGILNLDINSTLKTDQTMISFAKYFMDTFNWDLVSFKLNICLIGVSLFIVILIISSILSYKAQMLLQRAGQQIIYNLREEVFTHIENLSIGQINRTPVGTLVSRVTSNMDKIDKLYTQVIVNLIRYFFTIVFVLVIMLYISPLLTLMISGIAIIIFISTIIFNKIARRAHRVVRGDESNMTAFLSENISGMKMTQIFNQEDKKLKEFDVSNNKLKKDSIIEIIIFGIYRPMVYVFYVISQIVVLYFGWKLVNSEVISVASYVSFDQYIYTFFNPIQQLADQFDMLQNAFASAEKIFSILDTKPEVLDKSDAKDIDHFEGKIEFKNVWFAYNDENWILKDVSFVVYPKQTVAFVGATGAGKTTILGLITRNYEIQKGTILIDDIPIQDIKIESLRSHIGQMLQDVFLFSGTIKTNITLKDEKFSDDDVIHAMKYVNLDKVVSKYPDGINYKVLERGANFSAGERQLISFARTVIHKPNIMILDEATSNIDTETEVLIQDSLEKMKNVGTMLIVAHRLSTIQHADNIIVLSHGEIKESGNHQELLSKKGMYYNLYELQYKHMEE